MLGSDWPIRGRRAAASCDSLARGKLPWPSCHPPLPRHLLMLLSEARLSMGTVISYETLDNLKVLLVIAASFSKRVSKVYSTLLQE